MLSLGRKRGRERQICGVVKFMGGASSFLRLDFDCGSTSLLDFVSSNPGEIHATAAVLPI